MAPNIAKYRLVQLGYCDCDLEAILEDHTCDYQIWTTPISPILNTTCPMSLVLPIQRVAVLHAPMPNRVRTGPR